MAKVYRVTLTAMALVSTAIYVEIEDDELDEDGMPPDDATIEDRALEQAEDGFNVDWEFDGVDHDTIEVGTVTRRWSE